MDLLTLSSSLPIAWSQGVEEVSHKLSFDSLLLDNLDARVVVAVSWIRYVPVGIASSHGNGSLRQLGRTNTCRHPALYSKIIMYYMLCYRTIGYKSSSEFNTKFIRGASQGGPAISEGTSSPLDSVSLTEKTEKKGFKSSSKGVTFTRTSFARTNED